MSRLTWSVRDEAGFALPFTLFVIAIITIMLAAIFVRVQADRRVADSSGDIVRASGIAQSGLQTRLAALAVDSCTRPIRPVNGDSVRINVSGGYANVISHVVREPADTMGGAWSYLVRSTGFFIEPTMGADPQASRTTAQFSWWQSGQVVHLAAFTAANGLLAPTGGTGEFRGVDQATPTACRRPDISSIRVPTGESPAPLGGSYTTTPGGPQASGTGLAVATATGIDWAATIGSGLVPDFNSIQTWNPSYPVMRVIGTDTLNTGSTYVWGTLIVTGDLVIRGNFLQFYGVLLVGGRIRFESNDARFDGIVISGLNERLGIDVPRAGLGNGYVDIDYDSRYVRLAMQQFAGFAPIPNAWVENWATY